MSRARIVVHYSRVHFVRLCSGFKVHTNADIPARVRLTGGKSGLPPSERTVFPAVLWNLGKVFHSYSSFFRPGVV